MDWIRARIRDIPGFPREGVVFRDITPLLSDPQLFRQVVEAMAQDWRSLRVDKVLAIESRGFIFGAPLAATLSAGFAFARKFGTLPRRTLRETYTPDGHTVEIHEDAIAPGENVLVVDDLLATGATAAAVGRLVERAQGKLLGFSFLVELGYLNGVELLGRERVHALVRYT
ncbi:MAG: adenine phosphoribosyltransferase [Myxococcales bacterium]|nr:adenine phosphoribosyltransferase [Myxococcales bacterium]